MRLRFWKKPTEPVPDNTTHQFALEHALRILREVDDPHHLVRRAIERIEKALEE